MKSRNLNLSFLSAKIEVSLIIFLLMALIDQTDLSTHLTYEGLKLLLLYYYQIIIPSSIMVITIMQ